MELKRKKKKPKDTAGLIYTAGLIFNRKSTLS